MISTSKRYLAEPVCGVLELGELLGLHVDGILASRHGGRGKGTVLRRRRGSRR